MTSSNNLGIDVDATLDEEAVFRLNEMTNGTGLNLITKPFGNKIHQGNSWINSKADADDNWMQSLFEVDPAIPEFTPTLDPLLEDWFDQLATTTNPLNCEVGNPNNNFTGGDDELCCLEFGCYPPLCGTDVAYPDCEELIEYLGGNKITTQSQAWQVQQQILDWWQAYTIAAGGPNIDIPSDLLECWHTIPTVLKVILRRD